VQLYVNGRQVAIELCIYLVHLVLTDSKDIGHVDKICFLVRYICSELLGRMFVKTLYVGTNCCSFFC
jgi:hypothetical protein